MGRIRTRTRIVGRRQSRARRRADVRASARHAEVLQQAVGHQVLEAHFRHVGHHVAHHRETWA